ncbi:MAG: hypothetical protein COC01_09990 [Bacteroidetes bacterium]|nr:MAG: hypothetical protein COC01_09990 [Bacteroidota bacterium]
MLIRNKALFKTVSVSLAVAFLNQLLFPLVSYGLTGGPNQPEFSSFESVTTTQMVNEFTGDFTYNIPIITIPGPNGSSYPLTLSYHSGVSPTDEASWVGYGWTLNPGSIVRNKKGFPDDYKGSKVKYWNKTPANWTVTLGGNIALEAWSKGGFAPSGNTMIRYNNYKGFGYTAGLGLSLGKGLASLGYNISDGEGKFSAHLNPAEAVGKIASAAGRSGSVTHSIAAMSSSLTQINVGQSYGLFSTGSETRPLNISQYRGWSTTINIGVAGMPLPIQVGASAELLGTYTRQKNIEEDELNAYGYMYLNEVTKSSDDNNIMDYYVEKESTYNKRDKFLSIPFANADEFMINGEGIRGSFRLHHKKMGHFYPNRKVNETIIYNNGVEVDLGQDIGGGADIGAGYHRLEVHKWVKDSDKTLSFSDENVDEPFFFRLNGDMGGSLSFDQDDKPVQAGLSGGGVFGFKKFTPDLNNINTSILGDKRVGRKSYVAYRTNSEIGDTRHKAILKCCKAS